MTSLMDDTATAVGGVDGAPVGVGVGIGLAAPAAVDVIVDLIVAMVTLPLASVAVAELPPDDDDDDGCIVVVPAAVPPETTPTPLRDFVAHLLSANVPTKDRSALRPNDASLV